MEDNQIESIIKDCQITSSSQEESPSSPVQVTGIIMVSPPESNAEEEEEEEEEDFFHTPPDINRLFSSDDAVPEIRPEIRPDNFQVDPKIDVVGGSGDAVMSVDLGKDSGTLGFSEPNSVVYGDDDCVKKHVICLEANGSKVELDSKNMSEVVESEFDHRSENSRHTELMVIASGENVESENGREMEAKVSEEDTEFVDKQMVTYANPGVRIFRSGDTREGVLARRPRLPNSNVGGGAIVPWQSLDDRDTVNDLFNPAGILFDDTTDDTDFLEAAMECGITFHRPRWWP